MTSRFYIAVLVFFNLTSFLPGMSPESVDSDDKAATFLKEVSAILPYAGTGETALYPQIIPFHRSWIWMPAVGITGRLTETYSFFVAGGVDLGRSEAWYFNSYGLSGSWQTDRFPGEWVVKISMNHADHPDWKNRLIKGTGGGMYVFKGGSAGIMASINYENGLVRSPGGPYRAEEFYLSAALLLTVREWHLKIRKNPEAVGCILSRRIQL